MKCCYYIWPKNAKKVAVIKHVLGKHLPREVPNKVQIKSFQLSVVITSIIHTNAIAHVPHANPSAVTNYARYGTNSKLESDNIKSGLFNPA